MKNQKVTTIPATNYAFRWLQQLAAAGYDITPCLEVAELKVTDLVANKYLLTLPQHKALFTEMFKLDSQANLIELLMDKMTIKHHGILGVLAFAGVSLRSVARAVILYHPLRNRNIKLKPIEEDGYAIIRVSSGYEDQAFQAFTMQMSLRAIVKAKQLLIGKQDEPDILCLSFPKPEAHAIYTDDEHLQYEFSSADFQLKFPRKQLDYKIVDGDSASFNLIKNRCAELLRGKTDNCDVLEKIRFLLSESSADFPSHKEMAAMLHMSERTLARRLKIKEIAYQSLLDEERVKRCKQLLTTTNLSITQIAQHVYCADASHLNKLFKKLNQQSPLLYTLSV